MPEATKVTYTIQLQDGSFWATVQDHSAVPPRPLTFANVQKAEDAAAEARADGRNARIVKTTVSIEIIESV